MEQTINYKKRLYLAAIPFVGWIIAVLGGVRDIKKSQNLLVAGGYYFLVVLATAPFWGIFFVIGKYAVMPLEIIWVKSLLYFVLCLLMAYSMGHI